MVNPTQSPAPERTNLREAGEPKRPIGHTRGQKKGSLMDYSWIQCLMSGQKSPHPSYERQPRS
jgi:hypothetical protein